MDAVKQEPQEQPKPKHPVDRDPEFKCPTCSKSFLRQPDMETHIKLKHEKETAVKSKPKVQPRNRVLEMQQNEHEDMIYSYLGELG
jgi:uncharacterized C2H2 Zn-finger protein